MLNLETGFGEWRLAELAVGNTAKCPSSPATHSGSFNVSHLLGVLSPVNHRGLHQGSFNARHDERVVKSHEEDPPKKPW